MVNMHCLVTARGHLHCIHSLNSRPLTLFTGIVTPGFVVTELIIWLNEHKIIWRGYTRLQELVSRVLSEERQRQVRILAEQPDNATIADLNKPFC